MIERGSSQTSSTLERSAAHHPARLAASLRELSAVELEVAHLMAQGLRNREIARALFRSEKTIEKHVGQIFRKLSIDQLRDRFDRRVLTCLAVLAADEVPNSLAVLAMMAQS